MRRLSSLALPALAAFTLVCAGSRKDDAVPTVRAGREIGHTEAGIRLRVPPGWTFRRGRVDEAILLRARGPREFPGDFRENISIAQVPFRRSFSASELRASHLRDIAARYPRARVVATGDLSALAGTGPLWAIVEVFVHGFPLKDKIYYYVRGRRGLVLTCSTPYRYFERNQDLFDAIAASLRFESSPGPPSASLSVE